MVEDSEDPIVAGNIDLYDRPKVANPNGGTSTVYSMSFQDENPSSKTYGLEVLVPLADSGRILTNTEAINRYYETGKHLGVFSDPESATAYAQKLHKEYEEGKYEPKTLREHEAMYGMKNKDIPR